MPAYVIGTTEITDPAALAPYLEAVPATIAKYGGRFLAAGPLDAVLEGDVSPSMGAVIVFDSVEDARAWYASPEYAAVRVHRHRAGRSSVLLLDGSDEPEKPT